MQNDVLKGLIAGLAATLVLSALMMIKSAMGVMPELDVIAMLTTMIGGSTTAAGWIAHFTIGVVLWGGLFALLASRLPGEGFVVKGILFGIIAWVLMMITVMPMSGAGLFGLKMGMMAPVMTLVLHVIYGAVLGGIYAFEGPLHTAPHGVERR